MRHLICIATLLAIVPCGALRAPLLAARTPRLASATPVMGPLLGDDPLPPERIVAAVETTYSRRPSAGRLTAADVSAESGIPLDEAASGLTELASALAGTKGVSVASSNRGELLYSFPPDVRKELASLSTAAKAREAWSTAKPVLATVGRVAFGLALFASIALVFTAITVITEGSRDERDDRRRDEGGFGGGGFGGNFMFGYGYSPLDLFFPRPFGFYSYGWWEPPPRMSLPEAIFSFVFGDGDPNAALSAARTRGVADVIRANGGAVVAEQLAPFLDPPARLPADPGDYNVDESWVLPAVTQLGGRQEVTSDGTIVYVFDDLRVSALAADADLLLADPALAALEQMEDGDLAEVAAERGVSAPGGGAALRSALREWASSAVAEASGSRAFPDGVLLERDVPFSNAEGGQLFAAGALGLVNLFGVGYLGSLLGQFPPGVVLPDFLGLVQGLYPALVAYAVGYVALPAARFATLSEKNRQVEERNRNRIVWRDALRSGAGSVGARLQAARQRSKGVRVVREADVAFDSSKELAEQPELKAKKEADLDDFDRRLQQRG